MWIQSCCESLLACEKGSAACCTSIDRMWSTRNPGFTSSKCCRLRSSSPAPISATSANAISETTRMSCVLRGPDPAVPLLPCLRAPARFARSVRSAGTRPQMIPAAAQTAAVNASTAPFKPPSRNTPRSAGTSAISARRPLIASTSPTAPHAKEFVRIRILDGLPFVQPLHFVLSLRQSHPGFQPCDADERVMNVFGQVILVLADGHPKIGPAQQTKICRQDARYRIALTVQCDRSSDHSGIAPKPALP